MSDTPRVVIDVAAIRDARALMAAIYHEVSARKLDALVKSKKSPTMLEGVRIYCPYSRTAPVFFYARS